MEFKIEKRKRFKPENMEARYYSNRNEELVSLQSIVNSAFKKSFTIIGNERYLLPKPESMFIESSWQIEELQEIKANLNEIKSKLNNYCFDKWHQHTSYRNKAKDIEWRIRRDIDPEFVTQAWCKFHEIVTKYPLVPKEKIFTNNNKFLSLHLCEAPGAFITCLNHWLKTNLPTVQWDWLAMTFNPYYEGNSNTKMISDDRFIMYTLRNWFFGKDNSGNLMCLENLDALIEKTKSKGKVHLITADGSVNCIHNPGEQETIVADLHFCETVAAMHILEAGGNFLLKIFTIFEHQSICLIYFLSCVFNKIHFYKPVTSKEGNSEVYMICLGFKGPEFVLPYLPILKNHYAKSVTAAMFNKTDLPESFIEQIISCAQLFKCHQCNVIEDNISTYETSHDDNYRSKSNFHIKRITEAVATRFMSDFPIQKLHIDLQIVGNLRLKKKSNNWVIQPIGETFNERQKKRVLEPVDRLLMYEKQFESLELDSKVYIFKPSNHSIEVCVNIGRPYERVQSSRFCTVQIVEIYNLFFQVVDIKKNSQLCLPTKDNIDKYEYGMQQFRENTYKILHFQYTEICNNNQTITRIEQVLTNLQEGDNLVLIGFLLLTQFNVGLIYLLSHTFDSVEFNTNNEIGCSVIFKSCRNKKFIIQKIHEISDTAKLVAPNNLTILSTVSVTELYDSELFPMVVKLNNWIVKFCLDYIASIYSEQK